MIYPSRLCMLLCLYFESITAIYAQQGCCSYHGGVLSCDDSTKRIQCQDGTLSPTCTCGEIDSDNSAGYYTPAPYVSPPQNLYTILGNTHIPGVKCHKSGTIYVWTDNFGSVHFSDSYSSKDDFIADKVFNECTK